MVKFTDSSIDESSGLDFSHIYANTLYTFNDETNGTKQVKVVSSKSGATIGTFGFTSSTFKDPEAIRIEPKSPYKLWLADIGDNDNNRNDIHLTSIAVEPGPGNHGNISSEKYKIKYPMGARNAETLMIHPATLDKYIITKGNSGYLIKFKYGSLDTGNTTTGELISKSMPKLVSDGTFTIDGEWMLLRCAGVRKTIVMKFSTKKIVGYIDGPSMKKCEGITMDPSGNSFWLSSEGKYAPIYNVQLPSPYRPKSGGAIPGPITLC